MPYVILQSEGLSCDKTIVHGPSADLQIINANLSNNECHLLPTIIINILEERRGYAVKSHSVCSFDRDEQKLFLHTWLLHTAEPLYPAD